MNCMLICRPPSARLAPWVEMLWACEDYVSTHRLERIMPNGRFQIVVDLFHDDAPSVIVGMSQHFGVIETARLKSMVGVLFRPAGAAAFLGAPAAEFREKEVSLELVWGAPARRLREQLQQARDAETRFSLVETALAARLSDRAEVHPAVQHALQRLYTDAHVLLVSKISHETGWSRRRIAQLFGEQVGLPPKVYCRIVRFQRVVQDSSEGRPLDWATVAAAGGYSDQAHLSREFREFSGLTPTEFLASARPFPNHVAIEA